MVSIRITKTQARRFMLNYHGLYGDRLPMGKKGILEYVRRVGCIQYDPLNIVGHNQELVLQSRIDGFKPVLLQELLYKDRLLLDGWDKVMSIYLTSDWPYFSRYRASRLEWLGSPEKPVVPFLPLVRNELEQRGPLSSIDLEYDQTVQWPWGPTRVSRAALESMWFWGELIIHHKVNTRKYYDFAGRYLPEDLLNAPDPNETFERYRDWRICRRIGGTGFLWDRPGDAWLEIPGTKTPERRESIQRLLAEGILSEINVEGVKAPLYMRTCDMPVLDEIMYEQTTEAFSSVNSTGAANAAEIPDAAETAHAAGIPGAAEAPDCAETTDTVETADGRKGFRVPSPRACILAPLDNLLWDRKLAKEIFDFDYRWEVYKPQSERSYGYYVLPVLYADRFIARFEPGFDKKSKTLVIKNWWWEAGVKPTKLMQRRLVKCFRLFSEYLGADNIEMPRDGSGNTDDSIACWLKNV